MKLTVKAAISAALLGAASAAYAQITPVAIPGSFPTDGSLAPSTNNGGVIIEAWDPITGASLTEFTGLHFNDIVPSVADAGGGYTADFGVIGGSLWASTFGSDTNPIDFMVTSAINATAGSASVITTLNNGTLPTFRNSTVTNAAAKFGGAIGILTSGIASTASQAIGANPAQTLSTSDNGYAVITTIGGTYGGAFGANNVTNGVVGGSGVGLYEISNVSGGVNTVASLTRYANASGNLIVNVASNGDFTITAPGASAVPIPAAVWLLGSGLLGLAGIGRRRATPSAA